MARDSRVKKGGRRRGAGRPPKLSDELAKQLRDMALEHHVSMADLVVLFERKTGVSVNRATARKALLRMGLTRAPIRSKEPTPESAGEPARPKSAGRYGYTKAHRDNGERYSTSLTDAEWALVRDLFEQEGPGRPSRVARRRILDACCYVVRTGCAWRLLPKRDFPPWENVYAHFRRWAAKGLFEKMSDRFRVRWREREHRTADPSAVVIDSQSVKSTAQGGPKGFDAGKKVKGRKRHLVTDVLGLLIALHVTTADVQDRDAALAVLAQAQAKCSGIKTVFADGAYAGKSAAAIWTNLGIDVDIQRRSDCKSVPRWEDPAAPQPEPPKGFVPVRKRWVVERTNGWSDRSRRLSKEYDRRLDVSSAWVWLTHARLLLHRIALDRA